MCFTVAKNIKIKMYLDMVLGSIIRRRSRLIVLLTSLIICTATVSAVVNLYMDIDSKMKKELRAYGANIMIVPGNGEFMPKTMDKKIIGFFDRKNIAGYSAYLYGFTKIENEKYVITGVDSKQFRKLNPYLKIENGRIDLSGNKILAGKNVASKLYLEPKSDVVIGEQKIRSKFNVSGIIESGGVEDDHIFMSMENVRKIINNKTDINAIYVSYISDNKTITDIVNKINKKYQDVEAAPIRKISQSEGNVLSKVSFLITLVVLSIFISTLFCAGITLMSMIMERRKEIALKKAMGATNKLIFNEFLGESVFIGIIGGTFGWIIGAIIVQFLGKSTFNSFVNIRAGTFILSLIIAIMVMVISSVFPLKLVSKFKPAVILKGE